MSADRCPYCGGDESKRDWNWLTEHCNQQGKHMEIKTPTTVEELEAILNSEDKTSPITIRPDGTIQQLHPRRLTEPLVKAEWPDPTPEMLADPKFEAIWQRIKSWDINVPEVYGGYCGANGNHVRAILDALAAVK